MNRRAYFAAAAALLPTLAFAHPGHVHSHGFFAGLLHPWTGIDHVAAMLAAGLWASRTGRRALLVTLCASAIGIAAGAALGVMQGQLTLAEQLTAGSAIVLGMLATSMTTARVPMVASVVGLFCLFHGYVHAGETPRQFWEPQFTVGFAASMLMLQAVGAALATLLAQRTIVVRAAAVCCAAAGVVALAQVG